MPGSFANAMMKFLLTTPLHPLLGDRFAVITVTGRKTGRRISTPINVAPDGSGYAVISLRARTWWRNLRENRTGELRLGGKTVTVTANIIEQTDEVKASLRAYFDRYPAAAKYFGIRPDPTGRIPDADLERAARERLMIRLLPALRS